MDGNFTSVVIAQRRGALRRAVSVPAEVASSAWTSAAEVTVTNLSEHGLWLRSEHTLSVGESLCVSFRLPGSQQRVRASARVVRVAASCGCALCAEIAGMGLCFTELPECQREALERSLRGLPPPLPRAAWRAPHAESAAAPIIPACALMTTILSHTRLHAPL
jgi:Tfp pilus assembly protein PilZ